MDRDRLTEKVIGCAIEVHRILGIDKAQLLSDRKQSGISTGLLLNFNVQLLNDGITRFKL